ncbi:hypothetical protein QFZ64_001142 [Streptomyces sp. B3I8]|nr:hypothetical protein [Streptomyces sp. B3I8]
MVEPVLQVDDEPVRGGPEGPVDDVVERNLFLVHGPVAVHAPYAVHTDHVTEERELLPQVRGTVDPGDDGVGDRLRCRLQLPRRPGGVEVAGAQDAVQGAGRVAEAVDEAVGRLLEVPLLHQRAGEVEVRHVDGFEGRGLLREAVLDDEGGAAVLVEDGGVEAEAGARDDPVVVQLAQRFRGPGVAEHHPEAAAVGLLDALHGAVEHRVLGLELVGVQEVVVHRAQMAEVVGLPRELDRVRSGQMDDRGLLDEAVRGLERGVPLADDEHSLVGEGGGIRVEGVVPLGEFEARDVRLVEPGDAGGHDEASGPPGPSAAVVHGEDAVRAGDPDHLRPVLDAYAGTCGEVGQIAHEVVRRREVALGVPGEQQLRVVAEQRVPVHAQLELRVREARVHLVGRYQLPMAGVPGEERPRPAPPLQDDVVAPVAFQQ